MSIKVKSMIRILINVKSKIRIGIKVKKVGYGSASKLNSGPGSAWKWCESTTLAFRIELCSILYHQILNTVKGKYWENTVPLPSSPYQCFILFLSHLIRYLSFSCFRNPSWPQLQRSLCVSAQSFWYSARDYHQPWQRTFHGYHCGQVIW